MRTLTPADHARNAAELDLLRLQRPEEKAGYPDARDRALLLRDIDREQHRLGMSRAQVHGHVGLDPGTLDDSSMSTRCLRETLRILKLMQHPVQS